MLWPIYAFILEQSLACLTTHQEVAGSSKVLKFRFGHESISTAILTLVLPRNSMATITVQLDMIIPVWQRCKIPKHTQHVITVLILSFQTGRPWQTVYTSIRIRLILEEEQSDQGIHC